MFFLEFMTFYLLPCAAVKTIWYHYRKTDHNQENQQNASPYSFGKDRDTPDRTTSPHVLDLWCCGVGREGRSDRLPIDHHLSDNPFGNGMRIGEAKNPGPDDIFTISLINPTSILTRSQDIESLGADITAMSETSATSSVQHQFRKAMKAHGQTALFSSPVDSQKQRHDGLVSDRGLASGTALVAKLPMRKMQLDKPWSDHHQTRLQAAIVQLGATPVLVIVLYGFQQNLPQSKKKTNQLVTEAADLLMNHKGPSILLGDFNHR